MSNVTCLTVLASSGSFLSPRWEMNCFMCPTRASSVSASSIRHAVVTSFSLSLALRVFRPPRSVAHFRPLLSSGCFLAAYIYDISFALYVISIFLLLYGSYHILSVCLIYFCIILCFLNKIRILSNWINILSNIKPFLPCVWNSYEELELE